MAVLKFHRAPDGVVIMTREEFNSFTQLEREFVIQPLIDKGRARIVPDPESAGAQ